MAPYQYSPLRDNEIRILRLSPRRSGSLCISIERRLLSATHGTRPYEALSYVWGSPENPAEIEVQPNATDSPQSSESSGSIGQALSTLSITRNLADTLPYLQHDDSSRDLWIDAICINQRGDVEKSQQVNQMAQIYRGPSQVIAWLGPAGSDTPS
jgi:Heterokaryon incompatibility protein (HET)